MVIFPNCKINLGLHIVAKRSDGYHNLETIFYPLPFYDVLEILPANQFSFTSTGLVIDSAGEDNLCVKAYRLLQQHFNLPPVYMHLHKTIPMGAGLGGGSSDAAHTLLLLNRQFNLQLETEALVSYALQLGSDCPFFIINKPCYATGRGEKLDPLNIPALEQKQLVIIYPGVHINTGWAFGKIVPGAGGENIVAAIQRPLTNWKQVVHNHFEPAVFGAHASLADIKQQLYDAGALYASMTGSGSTLFGIFEKEAIVNLSLPASYFTKTVSL